MIVSEDLNIYHRRWLLHSNANTPIGAEMKVLCDTYGLLQLVKEPTREQYLLDLFLSDLPGIRMKVLSAIADHKAILAHVPLPEVTEKTICRYSWKLGQANWKELEKDLQEIDWQILLQGTAQNAMTYLLEMISLCLQEHIPYRKTIQKKSSHPWINERCKEAIAKKNTAEGSADFEAQRKKCTEVLAEEYQNYLALLREKIATIPRWSKQ